MQAGLEKATGAAYKPRSHRTDVGIPERLRGGASGITVNERCEI